MMNSREIQGSHADFAPRGGTQRAVSGFILFLSLFALRPYSMELRTCRDKQITNKL
jgi:hypothetical protein